MAHEPWFVLHYVLPECARVTADLEQDGNSTRTKKNYIYAINYGTLMAVLLTTHIRVHAEIKQNDAYVLAPLCVVASVDRFLYTFYWHFPKFLHWCVNKGKCPI